MFKVSRFTYFFRRTYNIKVGDVFTWKENGTKWIVYLQFLEESAYFRGEIRLCSNVVTIDGKDFWAYVRGPLKQQFVGIKKVE